MALLTDTHLGLERFFLRTGSCVQRFPGMPAVFFFSNTSPSCMFVFVFVLWGWGGELCHLILRGGGAPSQSCDALSDRTPEEQHTCEKLALLKKTSQELRMLSRSLSDCKSLLLNVMIQVSQFVSNSSLCH